MLGRESAESGDSEQDGQTFSHLGSVVVHRTKGMRLGYSRDGNLGGFCRCVAHEDLVLGVEVVGDDVR